MVDGELLSSLKSALEREPDVRLALLFGSTVTGHADSSSDIDLLVDLHGATLGRLSLLAERLASATGRPVDLVRLQDAESDPLFLADVLAVAQVLIDRDDVWSQLSRREVELRERGAERERGRAQAALAGIDRLLGERA